MNQWGCVFVHISEPWKVEEGEGGIGREGINEGRGRGMGRGEIGRGTLSDIKSDSEA